MNNENVLTASAAAQQLFLTKQVNIFLFDLKNEAVEHGFKDGESWHLEMASSAEILTLKRTHHPVVSLKLKAENLLKVYQQVKERLKQTLSKTDEALTETDLLNDGRIYITAYPLRNVRK